MESIRELFKIGVGPSSSHTIGPMKISQYALEHYPNATRFEVILYGSLALTGKGHLTDEIIARTLGKPVSFSWQIQALPRHPNGMKIRCFNQDELLDEITAYSIGGGSVVFENEVYEKPPLIYPHSHLSDIEAYIEGIGITLFDYICQIEDEGFMDYLKTVLDTMCQSVEDGLNTEGILPGKLALQRVAAKLHRHAIKSSDPRLFLTSYAYAVSEQNASGSTIVTAPTCGASGVLPAILYYARHDLHYSDQKCIEALAIAGLIGNIVKTNATISGAEGGCQAEVGTAIAMGAAAFASLLGLLAKDIEYAAEMGLEHQLGLTCDPVGGYVQIPCIERNGLGALRAIDCATYAKELGKIRSNRVSFDAIVKVMKDTGKDLKEDYRETSLGGLAKEIVVYDK